jgi:hypothetical protein
MTNGKPGRSQPPDRLLCKSVPALRSPTSRRSRCFFSRDANNCALLGYRLPLRDRKFADSPLEGSGFEPSVPREPTPMSACGFQRRSGRAC